LIGNVGGHLALAEPGSDDLQKDQNEIAEHLLDSPWFCRT
jgi:hypothetical protein